MQAGLDCARDDEWIINTLWGQGSGKTWEKILNNWGKEWLRELSTKNKGYPQSYPQDFPRALQRLIQQSTDPTTITTLIKIYWY